jgi:hypothetical protein
MNAKGANKVGCDLILFCSWFLFFFRLFRMRVLFSSLFAISGRDVVLSPSTFSTLLPSFSVHASPMSLSLMLHVLLYVLSLRSLPVATH